MSVGSSTLFKIFKFKPLQLTKIYFNACATARSKYYENVDPLPTKYGGKTNVTVLPGIGIGPELMKSTLEILDAAEAPLSYEIIEIDADHEDKDFEEILSSIRRNKVVIKANIESKSKDPTTVSRNVSMRKLLDLYVYVLPCKSFPGIPTRYPPVDVVIVRQNTEGEYLMLEHEPIKGKVESLKVVSMYNSERFTEGLFVQAALKVSQRYPQIVTKVKEAGTVATEIMTHPDMYDMILASNLNGSIISNIINGMLGGPALSAGTNISENGIAVFEPGVRNKGSGIVNKGIANPTAMVMAAYNLLYYLGHDKTAEVIKNATYRSLVFDRLYSQDLGGKASTREITDNIIRHVRNILGPMQRDKRPSKVKHERWKATAPQPKPKPKPSVTDFGCKP